MFHLHRIYCRILTPICAPIAGAGGDILAAWLGHPDFNLRIVDPVAHLVRRRALVDEGELYGSLRALERRGVIRPLTDADAHLLQRFRRSA